MCVYILIHSFGQLGPAEVRWWSSLPRLGLCGCMADMAMIRASAAVPPLVEHTLAIDHPSSGDSHNGDHRHSQSFKRERYLQAGESCAKMGGRKQGIRNIPSELLSASSLSPSLAFPHTPAAFLEDNSGRTLAVGTISETAEASLSFFDRNDSGALGLVLGIFRIREIGMSENPPSN